ncbi:MMPL family transporter [Corynebacterium diphtheriae subsp. diphtheriae]|nr:MMPL family transporter [Corynebacterium diphtheriae subsp. diphtheriae]
MQQRSASSPLSPSRCNAIPVLAATFAVLMTQPIRELYQFGMAMMLGILIDTFIIRPLMAPAIVTLLGDRALLPAKPGQESREASMEPVPAS